MVDRGGLERQCVDHLNAVIPRECAREGIARPLAAARAQPGTWVTLLTDNMGNTFLVLFSLLAAVFAPVGMWSTRSVVHMSTGGRFRLSQAVIPMGNDAKIDWSVGDRPTAIVGFDQADGLAD